MLVTFLKGSSGSFVSLDQSSLQEAIETVAHKQGLDIKYKVSILDKSHTQAASRVGGGSLAFHQVRILNAVTSVNGDVLFPMFQVKDRTYPGAALQIRLGFFRQVCSNGLFAFRAGALESIRHTPNNRELIARLDERISIGLERITQLEGHVAQLQTRRVNPFLAVSQLGLPPTVQKEVERLIVDSKHRPEDNPHTVWGLYNLVNEVDARMARRNSTARISRDHVLLDRIERAIA